MGMSCFLVQNARASQMSRVFEFTFHLFLLLEALQSFVRLLEVLEVFGMVWKGLEGSAGFGGFCEAMGSFETVSYTHLRAHET